jgi:hypothetical protein
VRSCVRAVYPGLRSLALLPLNSLAVAAFSGAIDSYFKWPRSWDVPGLSEAFSPQYSLDAWASDA